MNPEKDLQINENALDKEWLKQASNMYNSCVELAEARKQFEKQKLAVDVIFAQVEMSIRSDAENAGAKKPTESNIKAMVEIDPRCIKAQEDLIEARNKIALMEAVVQALDHKKKALENLVTLWSQGYFAEPKVSTEAATNVTKTQTQQRVSEKLTERMKR